MSRDKILLCRPRGGLNDILVQIEKCWRYALESNRALFVDTLRGGFSDSLNHYFRDVDGMTFGVPHISSEMTIFPTHDSLRDVDYKIRYDRSLRKHILIDSGEPITFDFTKNYSQDILIHHQSGGGNQAIEVLKKLKLLPNIAKKIRKQISDLGDYDSIHVRNTDYKTKYKLFFSELKIPSERNIALCSDDFACQEYGKFFFSNRVFIPNPAPDTNQKPLHNDENLPRLSTNISAIADLLILASGKNLHFSTLDPDSTGGRVKISGFSTLAKQLHENPSVINHLLVD